ncbi:MAG: M28 family peptidase, partial [Gammaproteobacteria bacterium]
MKQKPKPDIQQHAENLRMHVWHLAGKIGERHSENPGSLERAAQYIEQEFTRCGLVPGRQSYGKPPFHNVIAAVAGAAQPEEIIVVGAHYDTVWLSPGADDNASGVAALLELACMLAPGRHDRTIRFVAFTNEEQPYAETGEMGSAVYVRD